MVVVSTFASPNLTFFSNRTESEFAKMIGLKPTGIFGFGVRDNHNGIILSRLSKMRFENSSSRTNFLNHISCSSSKGTHGDNIASDSCRARVSNNGFDESDLIDSFKDVLKDCRVQIPRIVRKVSLTVIAFAGNCLSAAANILSFVTYVLAFPSFMLAITCSMYVFALREKIEPPPDQDVWHYREALLGVAAALTFFSAIVVGVAWKAGLPLKPVLVGACLGVNILTWGTPNTIEFIFNVMDFYIFLEEQKSSKIPKTPEENEHIENFRLKVNAKKLDDGWSVAVEKLPVRIEDVSKIPEILEELEFVMKNDNDIVSEEKPPLCLLSQVSESTAELTLACCMKDTKHTMSKEEALSKFDTRVSMYLSIITRHGGAIVREEASEVKS